ncbi:MAG: (2Fe-2S) ferredoxin domain-containing protein [Clostridia bacterium]|nr:(2Fe-2S) ferredoxin domain-containing protein [Clostridia bacterium]
MKTLEELMALRDAAKAKMTTRDDSAEVTRVVVGMATCGIAAGARPVMNKFVEEVSKRGLSNVTVAQTGCIGMCQYEPIAEVLVPGEEKVTYVQLTEEKVAKIVLEHIVNGKPVAEYTVGAIKK